MKCVTGYNLTGLLVGSEGTLGVISEIILKLIPLPAARRAMMATFDKVDQASETVAAIIADRIVPATLEFLDNFTIRTVEDYSHAGLPVDAAALLLIEVDGHPAVVAEEADKVEAICRQHGRRPGAHRQGRGGTGPGLERPPGGPLGPGQTEAHLVLEDATVPRSQIPAMIRAIEEISRKFNLPIGTFGHAGDGNLHPTILTDRRNQEEWHRVEAAVEAIFDAALALGGTLSGEHGIGTAKSRFLEKEVGQGTILYSKRIKAALDPKNILNPGQSMGIASASASAFSLDKAFF